MSLRNSSALSESPRAAPAAALRPRREQQQRVSHHTPSSHGAVVAEPTAPLPDVFSHPAVVAYVANHPNRPIPKFGAYYYILQTLGEGEFGKVKLGLHSKYGEEVAVKLIRRETADNEGKMAKIAREIEILDMLKHPNIVRLYDVIETDKYIGIILEYASGGELFDHILAHRYLRERDAAKLFSQLISGIWYMHQKNIVHRDLKLENLLLDRHRNLIITDFGFANHFNRSRNDLMETMCGSPCYAAPELVNSDGLYVGTAADIWSCGVILYAMLSGYLPFDDDPTNPDGEDITKLYAYIARTPLSFPDHISDEACSLLGAMLVPDPHERADLATVMRHPWFAMYAREVTTFGLTVMELERMAEEGPTRRLAYQRGAINGKTAPQTPRSRQRTRGKHSDPPEVFPAHGGEWDPFARTGGPLKGAVGSPRKQKATERVAGEKGKEREREQGHKEDKFRHTIQVEYEERGKPRDGRHRERQSSSRGPTESHRTPLTAVAPLPVVHNGTASAFDGGGSDTVSITQSPTKGRRRRTSRSSSTKHGHPNNALPGPPSLLSSLESTAEFPPELNGAKDPGQPNQSPSDAAQESRIKTETRPQLAPLVIDVPANASSSTKQTFKTTVQPNMSDVGTQGSPSKPNKVMQWFRKGRRSITVSGPSPFFTRP
ncbi:kinase-like domain-containing protein [Mycena vulgaris]|nr:kinase-like domain-containing protein [Mycena vulgaris]